MRVAKLFKSHAVMRRLLKVLCSCETNTVLATDLAGGQKWFSRGFVSQLDVWMYRNKLFAMSPQAVCFWLPVLLTGGCSLFCSDNL